MKTRIEIRHIYGSLLFEFEKEDNTVKDTVIEAVKTGADLRGAYLTGANLTGADHRDANLTDADLRGAYLRDADLTGANLTDANLTDADLTGADLRGANLTGADLRGVDLRGVDGELIKIKKAVIFTGLYQYVVIPFISKDDIKYVKMGCYTRKLSDWESDFWNNDNEFPNDGSEKSNLRLFAFETAKKWFEIV